jgi:hypothetical protein
MFLEDRWIGASWEYFPIHISLTSRTLYTNKLPTTNKHLDLWKENLHLKQYHQSRRGVWVYSKTAFASYLAKMDRIFLPV